MVALFVIPRNEKRILAYLWRPFFFFFEILASPSFSGEARLVLLLLFKKLDCATDCAVNQQADDRADNRNQQAVKVQARGWPHM